MQTTRVDVFWVLLGSNYFKGNFQSDQIKPGLALDMLITYTMVIRPLDDCTFCARSAFTHLGLLAKAVRLFMA